MNWWRFGTWSGVILAGAALLLGSVNILYDINLIDLPRAGIHVFSGELSVWYRLPASAPSGASGFYNERLRPRRQPIRFGRARHWISVRANMLNVHHAIPLWLLFGLGLSLTTGALVAQKSALYRKGCCVRCGYDLRGTPGERCSECGHSTHPSWALSRIAAQPSAQRALLVYAGVGVLWAELNDFSSGVHHMGWPDWEGYAAFMAGLCGPLVWAVVPFWPAVDIYPGVEVTVTAVALAIWGIWVAILFRTRLRAAPTTLHVALAILWFCVAPFGVSLAIGLAMHP